MSPRPTIPVTSRERLRLKESTSTRCPRSRATDGVGSSCRRARALDPPSTADGRRGALRASGRSAAGARARGGAESLFSTRALLERLAERLYLLKAGPRRRPAPADSRATIEWSYDLLDAEEQRRFGRSPSSPAAARSRQRSRSPAPIPTSSVAARQEPPPPPCRSSWPRGTGCSRRSASSPPRSSWRRGRRPRSPPSRGALPHPRSLGQPRRRSGGPTATRPGHPRARQLARGTGVGTGDRRARAGARARPGARELLGDNGPQEGVDWVVALLDGASDVPDRVSHAGSARPGWHGEHARSDRPRRRSAGSKP